MLGGFTHQTVICFKVLTADMHVVAQNTGFNSRSDLGSAGCLCTVTNNATCGCDCVRNSVRNAIQIAAQQICNTCAGTGTGTCTCTGSGTYSCLCSS